MQTLTIILPCYKPPNSWNEIFKQNNQLVLQKFSDIQLSILVVDDGSQDNDLKNTLEYLQKENSNFRFIGYPENQGKGYALRKGVSAVTSDYYIITDIDFPYTTASIAAILETL
ncbi:MAG: glycosyltransferase [Bacteroidia bacterium]|nr:glycosyltransferase [Bacteroidia bacterium]